MSTVRTRNRSAEVDLPQWSQSARIVGIEGIYIVTFRRDINYVSIQSSDVEVRNIQRLCVNLSADLARKQLAEGAWAHVRSLQNRFAQVLPGATVVVVLCCDSDLRSCRQD